MEENSIAYSFVDSQFCALPFNCKIDEYLLGFNFYISDPDLGMATQTFMDYILHEGGISLHNLMFWFWIKVFKLASIKTKFSFPRIDVLQRVPGF
jgi:hypothetical protein